eukprot:CAMPEP_0202943378 /NCGR_PEP_ID=MMETSP1395-20130829/3813_1 /ASSEMBLY_ACC=CAM_ASM_000871 /TAXON_ID=5961 /ORGANISM="Blepharisma japonicum, Strain Stock R1072" /LENGTH=59 /DNA_ID=CAMNT_0049640791 /DNA_START=245 /DNA_END=420 /DNA_ORIENTATION=+
MQVEVAHMQAGAAHIQAGAADMIEADIADFDIVLAFFDTENFVDFVDFAYMGYLHQGLT